jgi:hypothetical protein
MERGDIYFYKLYLLVCIIIKLIALLRDKSAIIESWEV